MQTKLTRRGLRTVCLESIPPPLSLWASSAPAKALILLRERGSGSVTELLFLSRLAQSTPYSATRVCFSKVEAPSVPGTDSDLPVLEYKEPASSIPCVPLLPHHTVPPSFLLLLLSFQTPGSFSAPALHLISPPSCSRASHSLGGSLRDLL